MTYPAHTFPIRQPNPWADQAAIDAEDDARDFRPRRISAARLALVNEPNEALIRTNRIVDRLLPAFPFDGFSVSKAAVAADWAAIDRTHARRELHRKVLPMVRAKVRSAGL